MNAPVLVLLNGIPGSGKSTLARGWVQHHADPLAAAVDIDVIRGTLGRWREDPHAAGLAARAMAVAAIGVHLRAGHDVVVPQYLRRAEFAVELERAAGEAGARFVECVLVVDETTAVARLRARTAAAIVPGPEGDLEAPLEEVHADFGRFLATRRGAVVVEGAAAEDLEAAIRRSLSTSDR